MAIQLRSVLTGRRCQKGTRTEILRLKPRLAGVLVQHIQDHVRRDEEDVVDDEDVAQVVDEDVGLEDAGAVDVGDVGGVDADVRRGAVGHAERRAVDQVLGVEPLVDEVTQQHPVAELVVDDERIGRVGEQQPREGRVVGHEERVAHHFPTCVHQTLHRSEAQSSNKNKRAESYCCRGWAGPRAVRGATGSGSRR